MRRVGADGAEDDIPEDDPNYVSLTVRPRYLQPSSYCPWFSWFRVSVTARRQ